MQPIIFESNGNEPHFFNLLEHSSYFIIESSGGEIDDVEFLVSIRRILLLFLLPLLEDILYEVAISTDAKQTFSLQSSDLKQR